MPPEKATSPNSLFVYEDEELEEDEEEGYFRDFISDGEFDNPVTTPFISPDRSHGRWIKPEDRNGHNNQQFSVLSMVATALRRSLVTCSVNRDHMESDVDIGWPTDVRHVSHVTFDRFNGFLGLPVELQPDFPRTPPSASASVFGVSAQSMQCSYDQRGNSVPTILLRMQNQLYSEGGLQAEGIFRINAANSREELVRNQLNKGVVPRGIDVHCLAGLIKAWFRELPTGILDSLTPEQVMHCNTEEECSQLVKLLPPTEAALLDWAINLMADVVQNEHLNKMNARNIAMVFAPNMTQMADPLTALIHAVQVMNFLKTLISKTLCEREVLANTDRLFAAYADSTGNIGVDHPSNTIATVLYEQSCDDCSCSRSAYGSLLWSATLERLEADSNEKSWRLKSKSDVDEKYESVASIISPENRKRQTLENRFRDEYDDEEVGGVFNRLSLRKGVQKLCKHPVFQLSKPVKKNSSVGIVNTREGGVEACAYNGCKHTVLCSVRAE
ncbi:rho GTPase-activating protein 3-like [Olea europaea var. sylvestris]|uniref:rho GTPase-activating protein 3-like n=1 Tax=Olea europaea var. sylvestris TaxID=158386 RepID=UPI000C1D77F4|nr:rho GTPase-activating protein 3-like [Olea europaea var. sylvestris]